VDIAGSPFMLWSSIAIRLGQLDHHIPGPEWIYFAALLTSMPVFVKMGLYRAVIRYLGPRAVLTVATGVPTSVMLLALFISLWPQRGVPLGALVIYWAFALIY